MPVSDAAVEKATGMKWAEWFRVLDRAGAKKKSHPEIVAIAREHGASAWWQQMVTVEYERSRGLREVHQTATGYASSISRTIAAPVEKVYSAWSTYAKRAKLPIKKATENKSVRIEPHIMVAFYAKGASKTQIVIEETHLGSKRDVTKRKAHWADAIEALRQQFE